MYVAFQLWYTSAGPKFGREPKPLFRENNPSDWPSPTPEDKTNSSFFETRRPKPMTGHSVRNEGMREKERKENQKEF